MHLLPAVLENDFGLELAARNPPESGIYYSVLTVDLSLYIDN